ncbi:MAG: PASTA domain-containing protein, partial [Rhodothermia bacterium]|nr:PASTA domain-containing protein [Rhodothermia bacterium]
DGESLVLTIDLIRQTIVEEELASGVEESGSNWGTAIAMDPNTGAVLAMANFPTYDPNRPGRYPTEARRNHAITDRIEPGSTFKLVSAVASLEQGVVSLDDSIDTGNGYRIFGRRELRDTHGHGRISFQEVIAVSSNIGIAEAVKKLDGGDLYQYARNLGFGQPTWIDLPGEVGGSLKKPSSWSGTTKTSVSIGYEVDVTPIQLLTAYCALANGGLLVRPFLLQERRNYAGETVWEARQDSIRRAFKRKTARKLLPAFERVVNDGTAKSAQIKGVRVAGKTGTAWKVHSGSYSRSKARASFVGFFPADNPRVALIVVLDEPETSIYGGATAAPIFQRIADRWISTFPDLARERSIALAEDAQSATTESDSPDASLSSLPDVNGLPAAVAASRILAHGYAVDPPDAEDAVLEVVRQSPRPGRDVRRGAQIRLAVDHGSTDEATAARMPNLEGLSARQATFWLAKLGVRARVEGHGRVVSQSPKAGSDLQKNAVIRCK